MENVKGIRDILSHHYFDLDAEVIFNICKKDVWSKWMRKMLSNLLKQKTKFIL